MRKQWILRPEVSRSLETFEKRLFDEELTKKSMKLSCFSMNLLEQKCQLLLFCQFVKKTSGLFLTRKTS